MYASGIAERIELALRQRRQRFAARSSRSASAGPWSRSSAFSVRVRAIVGAFWGTARATVPEGLGVGFKQGTGRRAASRTYASSAWKGWHRKVRLMYVERQHRSRGTIVPDPAPSPSDAQASSAAAVDPLSLASDERAASAARSSRSPTSTMRRPTCRAAAGTPRAKLHRS